MGSYRDRLKKRRGKKDLERQHSEQEKRKDQKGRYPTVFKKDMFLKNMEVMKIKDGDTVIDIIPTFAGPDHPTMEEGAETYVLEYHVHQNIGPAKEKFICPYETYGEECEICNLLKSQFWHGKVYGILRPSRRTAYVVWNHNNREEEKKGPQIMDVAYKYMQKNLIDLARLPEGGGSIVFWDVEKGKRIMFTKSGKGTDTDFTGHKFLKRKHAIPDSILDKVAEFQLDQAMKLRVKRKKIKKLMKTLTPELIALNEKYEAESGSSSASSSSSDSDRKKKKKDKKKDKHHKKDKSNKKDKKKDKKRKKK